ncbi:MAG: non-ribosomal peptide synthetase [Acidimicrobiia bacterium]
MRVEASRPAMEARTVVAEPWKHGIVLGPHRARSLRDALGDVARALPERVAIGDDTRTLSYEELLRAVDSVAAAVRAERTGTGAVTVVVEHGIEAVVAILGVITAGRIAVPVDARDPLDRLAAIHHDAASSLVVTNRRCVATAQSLAAGSPVLVTDNLDPEELDPAGSVPERRAGSVPERVTGPAMLLFTSGSTGTPKGVAIGGENIVDNALQIAYVHGLAPEDRMSVPGSLAFGATHTRIFAALVSGARVCLYDLRERGPSDIPEWVNTNGITVMLFVPSVLRAVLEYAPHARMDTVRLVTFGGEALYGRDTRSARSLFGPDTVFRNRLSSTETHGMAGRVVTAGDDELDGIVPVGEIEPWLDARIVDDDDQEVPDGEPGRLVVIGHHFALGYWNDPDLTAERFVDLPDERRAFYTSDLVRRLHDGALAHVGRADDRVKVRGAMVSPMEAERALMQLEGVAAAAVKSTPAADGGLRLVAYVVPERDASPSASAIRRDLAALVPPTMVPGTVVMLDALPTGSRGKVDRAALPPPPMVNRPYRAPVGREQDLADIFGDVLGVDRIGLDDDFFDLGGDSLAAVELLVMVDEQFGMQLQPSTLLDAPTVALLAPLLVHRRPRGGLSTVVRLTAASEPGSPFFCVAGGGSPAITLRSLAESLAGELGDGRVTYGIQARGLEERSFPDHSVERSARRYLEEMRRAQPSGPYFLAGYSFGGVVAFEMACRLEAVGERVALLAILDSTAPGTKPNAAERFATRADTLRDQSSAHALRWAASSAVAHAQRAAAITTAGLVPRRGLRQYYVFYRVASRQRRRYRPTHTFGGPTLVLRATAEDHGELGGDLGWSSYLRRSPSVVDVPGNHNTMILRPLVSTLAAELSRAFDAASRSPTVAATKRAGHVH